MKSVFRNLSVLLVFFIFSCAESSIVKIDNVKTNSKYEVYASVNQVTDKIILHAKNYTHLWAWDDSGNVFDQWPGQLMTNEGDEWYTWTLDKVSCNLVFSKFGASKTVDMSRTAGEWWYDGEWHNSNPANPVPVVVLSHSTSKVRGSDLIKVTIKGDNLINSSITFNNINVAVVGETTSMLVENYLEDGFTGTIIASATNSYGTTTVSVDLTRDDSYIEGIVLHAKNYTHLWAWDNNNNNLFQTWPGQLMNSEGDDWYTWTIEDARFCNVIFSYNGYTKTPDMSRDKGEWWYDGEWHNSNPAGPSNVTELNAVAGDKKVTLTWKDPTDDDFEKVEIAYDNMALEILKGIEEKVIEDLTNDVNYTFVVKAVASSGEKSFGIPIIVTPRAPQKPAVTIDKESGNLKGSETITITIKGDNITNQSASFNNKAIVINSEVTVIKVSDYLSKDEEADLTIEAVNEVGTTTVTKTFKRVDPKGIILHARNYTHLWAWDDNNNNLFQRWPGQAMNSEGDDWYTWTIDDIRFRNVIFSNDGNNQTPDMSRDEGEWWYDGGWIEKIPSNVTEVLATPGDSKVTLEWVDPAESDIKEIEISYDAGIVIVPAGVGAETIHGLTNGVEYTFVIKAVNTSNNKSSGVTVKATPIDTTSPGDVSSLSAFPGHESITLSWIDPVDKDLKEIEITYNDISLTVEAGLGSHTISGLTYGVIYSFILKAVDYSENKSSGVIIEATPGDTEAPEEVTDLTAVPEDEKVTLSWTSSVSTDVKEMEVIYDNKTEIVDKDITNFTATNLVNGKEYIFKIKGVDMAGNKSDGVSIISTPFETVPPSPVTNLTGTSGNSEVTLSWKDPSDADLKEVEISYNGTKVIVEKDKEIKTIIGLTNDVEYTFNVVAIDTSGNKSDVATVKLTPSGTINFSNWGVLSTTMKKLYYKDIVVNGDYAYCAVGYNGLSIFDISNPANITLVSGCKTDGDSKTIYYHNNYVYIPLDNNCITIINVTNSKNPYVVGSYSIDEYIIDMFFLDNYAYIANSHNEIVILNISDTSNPVFVGSYDTDGKARCVSVKNSFAYITDDSGMVVLDISNQANPTFSGRYELTRAYEMVIKENVAYILDTSEGLVILDISDPSEPIKLGNYDGCKGTNSLGVSGNYAFTLKYDDSPKNMFIIDISDPTKPELSNKTEYKDMGTDNSAFYKDNFLYIVDQFYGLAIFDISNVQEVILSGLYSEYDAVRDVYVDGKYAYVAAAGSGLYVVDVSNSEEPVVIGNYNIGSNDAYDIVVSGNYAYVANRDNGFMIIDISNPSEPFLVDSYVTNDAVCIDVSDNYAYVGNHGDGLIIFDISDPYNITFVSYYKETSEQYTNVWSVTVESNYAYVGVNSNGVLILDILNPENPVLVGQYSSDATRYVFGVAIDGDYAYLAGYYGPLSVINISDKSAPKLIGDYSFAYRLDDAKLSGNYIYLAYGKYGVIVVDITSPGNLAEVCRFDSEIYPSKVFLANNCVYTSNGASFSIIGEK